MLARNVLLYTLLADLPSERIDESLRMIWNFYYHFFIDKGTLDMLLKQCQVLVDLSPDIETWNNSKYGTFIRFSSSQSFSVVRKHWKLYIGTKDFSKAEMESLRAEFRMGRQSDFFTGGNLTSLRAAGPLWTKMMDMGSKQFDRYWKTGVTFEERDKLAKANEINPTFAYSAMGKGFSIHYGSDPILSFHLAKSLAPISGSRSKKTVTISDLVKGAVEEFKSWCLTFSKRINEQRAPLVIRVLVGDVIAVCRALHYCAVNGSVDPGLYTTPWTSALMKLDGGDYVEGASRRAPVQFNVIDTSNLTDHIGLLNILIPCRPLMQTRPSSVIFTDTLLPSNDDGMARDGFLELLCGDVSVLSMILDLVPVSYLSNFTTHSNVHEMVGLAANSTRGRRQFHEHIAWRIGTLSDDSTAAGENVQLDQRLKFDELQLATFLYGVYRKMFSDENMGNLLQSKLTPFVMKKFSIVHYSRFTLAYVLRLVKDRVDVSWEGVMDHLHDLICNDQELLMGSNNVQDLFCSLHLLDVHSFMTFLPNFRGDVKKGPLKEWKTVPPVVCICLQVPRKSFNILEASNAKQIGTPVLHCALMAPSFHNVFPQYQSFWGKVEAEYGKDPSQEPKVTFEEDAEGFRGSSPAVFTFYVPSWFLDAPQKAAVSVRSNPNVVMRLAPTLGPYLNLFSAELTDRKYVHITRERPGNPGELQKLRKVSFARPTSQEIQPSRDLVKVTLDGAARQVAHLTGRANIEDTMAKASLTNGAAVSISQISPRVIQISIGSHLQTITYPFPINSSDSKTRIARKSAYVEVGTCADMILQIYSRSLQVDVKISGPLEKLGMSLKPFLVIQQDKILSLWNIHYLDLERLPALDLSDSSMLSFVKMHIDMSFCDREHRLCVAEAEGRRQTSDLDVITRVKQSLHHLVLNSCGLKPGEKMCPVVGLTDPVKGIFTLIFINAVCLDLASHTVVLDTCVLPLTEDLGSRLINAIGRVNAEGLMQTLTEPDEIKAWQHLLPAFTERCRKWSHTPNCEYLSSGIPVSEKIYQSPLCTCGRGKYLGPFPHKKSWKVFTPYVTRAAISPLFAVPFVDSIGADMLDAVRRRDNDTRTNDACANCYGPGKPKLLLCAACKNVSYCSASCQKADWKVHKKSCKKV